MIILESRLKIESLKKLYRNHIAIKNACNTIIDELYFIEEYINSLDSDKLDFERVKQ